VTVASTDSVNTLKGGVAEWSEGMHTLHDHSTSPQATDLDKCDS